MNRYCVVFLLSLLLLCGCGYGKVSPTTYELAKSLYNISNRKLDDKLEDVKLRIEEAQETKAISQTEAKWLQDIVQRAEKQEWKQAMKAARQIMEDQVTG